MVKSPIEVMYCPVNLRVNQLYDLTIKINMSGVIGLIHLFLNISNIKGTITVLTHTR